MKTNPIVLKALTLGVLAAIIAVLAIVAFAPTQTAFADPGTPPAQPDAQGRNNALEKLYQRELKWLAEQKEQLTKANNLLGKAQDFIDKQKAKGKDVTLLEKALEKVKQQVAKAQTAHDEAAKILNTHAGFANGKVTDRAQARQTVAQAQKSLREAHRILANVTAEVRRVLNHFRDDKGNK